MGVVAGGVVGVVGVVIAFVHYVLTLTDTIAFFPQLVKSKGALLPNKISAC